MAGPNQFWHALIDPQVPLIQKSATPTSDFMGTNISTTSTLPQLKHTSRRIQGLEMMWMWRLTLLMNPLLKRRGEQSVSWQGEQIVGSLNASNPYLVSDFVYHTANSMIKPTGNKEFLLLL
jgi:hypothetical protein